MIKQIHDASIYCGDALEVLKTLPDASVQCCVTSPPYFGLRDYGHDGQIGLEETPEQFVQKLATVFREVRRVLRDDGVLWVNIGDSYAGSGKGPAGNLGKANNERDMSHTVLSGYVPEGLKPKDLIGIPWMLAFALRADGWYLRQDIIWHKPNPMPESVRDRCTKSHEYIFLLSKSARYYYDHEAIKEEATSNSLFHGSTTSKSGANGDRNDGGRSQTGNDNGTRNKRSVWHVNTRPFKGAHFAVYPPELITPCILAGCPKGGTVLDPFTGSGTTGAVAVEHGRKFIGIELNPEYHAMSCDRLEQAQKQLKLPL